jgi:hypothetical protein
MRTLARSLNADLEITDGQAGYLVRFEVPLSDQQPSDTAAWQVSATLP